MLRTAPLIACASLIACLDARSDGLPVRRAEAKVIFGNDDRKETYELRERGLADLVAYSRATGLVTDTSKAASDGRLQLACSGAAENVVCDEFCYQCDIQWGLAYASSRRECVPSFEQCPDLCADEPFHDQLMVGDCSGFLVAPDLLVTAGHCLGRQPCSRTAIVFGYEVQRGAGGALHATAENLDTYHCREIVAASYGASSVPDWALLRLDRPVLDRVPLCLERSTAPSVGQSVVLAGFPMGLPLKVDDGGQVASLDPDGVHFEATTDSFAGSSGSAVLDAVSGRVLGVLARGPRYAFSVADGEGCSRSRVCDPATGCGATFPVVVRLGSVLDAVPLSPCYVPDQPCDDGGACSTDYCGATTCEDEACRVATCVEGSGCSAMSVSDCNTPCGDGSKTCVSGRCGDPRRDGFEQEIADYWSREDWFASKDESATGLASLRVAPTAAWTERTLSRAVDTRGGAAITFAYRIAAGQGDSLTFEVDGTSVATFHGGSSSGWSPFSYPSSADAGYLVSGKHTLVWRFRRGGGQPTGENAVWIDDVVVSRLLRSCPCVSDADCNDAVACNGQESCTNGACAPGTSACSGDLVCDEQLDACEECVVDADCGSGYCEARQCRRCASDADCEDGNVCNGRELCRAGACKPGTALACRLGSACTKGERCDPVDGCIPNTEFPCPDPEVPDAGSATPQFDAASNDAAVERDAGFIEQRVTTCACTVLGATSIHDATLHERSLLAVPFVVLCAARVRRRRAR